MESKIIFGNLPKRLPTDKKYPIRMSRNNWKIRFFGKHKCIEELCSKAFTSSQYVDGMDILIFGDNPDYKDGKCQKYDMIKSDFIQISKFESENPMTSSGIMINPDEIVIKEREIYLLLTYPLTKRAKISIRAPTKEGFRRKDLVQAVKDCYEYVYREEERTSVQETFNIEKKCEGCKNLKLEESIQIQKGEVECCICYSECSDNSEIGKLSCNHTYHKDCIFRWAIEGKKNSCPLCRKDIFTCKECNGRGITRTSFTGSVLPMEHRGVLLNRNQTSGKFGIYDFDIECLFLNYLDYDKTKKIVEAHVIG